MKIGLINTVLQKIFIKKRCEGYYLRWYYNGWHYWFFLPGQISLTTEGENYRTIGTRKINMSSGQVSRMQMDAIRTIMNTREVSLYTDDGWMNIRIDPSSITIYDSKIDGNEMEFKAIVGSRENYYSPVLKVPATHTIFDNPLYNPSAIVIEHHAEDGSFTIVLEGDGTVTIDWGDGTTDNYTLVPGTPQTITHDYPSPLADSYVITIQGEENITSLTAENDNITQVLLPPTIVNLETLDVSDNELTDLYIPPEATSLTTLDISNNEFTETPYIPPTVPLVTLTETGNPLTTCEVAIGSQVWMCYNYASNYPGSLIYNDDPNNETLYGRLYKWLVSVNSGFPPYGYHVPSLAEWQQLIDFVGGSEVAGGKLKTIGTTYWDSPNTGALDTYNFKARGAGFRGVDGDVQLKECSKFLTSTSVIFQGVVMAYHIKLLYNSAEAITEMLTINNHSSVRLIKNWATAYTPPVIYHDWYLGSLDEIHAQYVELYLYNVGDFDRSEYGSFYASSSELSSEYGELAATSYWGMQFWNNGVQFPMDKLSQNIRFRPCRKFISSEFYALRDIGPAGGLVFIVINNNNGTYTYHESYPNDIPSGEKWSNITDQSIGTTETAIGTGQSNTLAIINQAGHVNSFAKTCDDL